MMDKIVNRISSNNEKMTQRSSKYLWVKDSNGQYIRLVPGTGLHCFYTMKMLRKSPSKKKHNYP